MFGRLNSKKSYFTFYLKTKKIFKTLSMNQKSNSKINNKTKPLVLFFNHNSQLSLYHKSTLSGDTLLLQLQFTLTVLSSRHSSSSKIPTKATHPGMSPAGLIEPTKSD